MMEVHAMSTKPPAALPHRIPKSARIAVIAARFNGPIVERLLGGCIERLAELGVSGRRVEVYRVPGSFELPVAAKLAARTGRFSAIICLGAVIRGQTPHFDYVAGQTARGIAQVALEELLPVIFGVLTTENERQARERIGGKHGHAGKNAAQAAVEMIAMAAKMADG
jgi:6,7-dimethyl-8-ribityllumazine synthase